MNQVIYLMNNPQVVDELLAELNHLAEEHNVYEYGLPMFEDGEKAKMREVVYKWVNRLQAVKRPTKRALDAGDSAASQALSPQSGESTPEVNLAATQRK